MGEDMSDACRRLHEELEQLPLIEFPFNLEQLPSNGIYFFYERGEIWGHDGSRLRIVRIGTHHKNGNFRRRISEHYLLGQMESRMNFDQNRPKPSDRSIFRKNIGRALLYRDRDSYLCIWDVNFMRSENSSLRYMRDIDKERRIESEITRILRENFSFRFRMIDNQVGRRRMESSLIETVASCGLCRPSGNWLGNHSPVHQIRESGLWLVQHLRVRGI